MFKIPLSSPVVFVWGGRFENDPDTIWTHRESSHALNFELILVTRGELTIHMQNGKVRVREGEYIVIPPFATITGSDPVTGGLQHCWLHFICPYEVIDESGISQDDLALVSAHQYSEALNEFIYLPETGTVQDLPRVILVFQELLNELMSGCYTQRIRDYISTKLLIALSDDYIRSLARNVKSKKRSAQIAEWIRVNLDSHLSVAKIADHFDLNPSYLARLFHTELGCTVQEYIIQEKLELAKMLLTTTNETIEQIAARSYFNDSKNFMRLFKKKTGMTPSVYRNNLNKSHLNTGRIDPKSALPEQLGNMALKRYIHEIMEAVQQPPQKEDGAREEDAAGAASPK